MTYYFASEGRSLNKVKYPVCGHTPSQGHSCHTKVTSLRLLSTPLPPSVFADILPSAQNALQTGPCSEHFLSL